MPTFQADPPVPGLARIARSEINRRADHDGVDFLAHRVGKAAHAAFIAVLACGKPGDGGAGQGSRRRCVDQRGKGRTLAGGQVEQIREASTARRRPQYP